MMLVYLAHPIDQAAGRRKRDSDRIHGVLTEIGISVYRPGLAFTVARDPISDLGVVDRINRSALLAADALVAFVPSGVSTLGVPAEIEEALRSGKPTLILTDQPLVEYSVQIWNWRDRGAIVEVWDDERSAFWLTRPDMVINNLQQTPNDTELQPVPDLTTSISPRIDPALFFTRINPAANTPSRAYPGDAGLDLAIVGDHEVGPGEYKMLPTGIAAAVPDGYWGFMTGRSSAWSKWRFAIQTAVIDSGYRGELMVGVHNLNSTTTKIEHRTRLAQYVILPAFTGAVIATDELPHHERGTNGYGSSGR